MLEIKKV